jgi:hypothetical protein
LIRLGWYARLVIVLWVTWTVCAGVYFGYSEYYRALAGDTVMMQHCASSSDPITRGSPLCASDYRLSGEGPVPFVLNRMAQQGVYATLALPLAAFAYWAVRWILAGRSRRQT